MTARQLAAAALLLFAAACGADALQPATIVPGRDACASCRMVIASTATAAQILAPGEEPRLFDDLACLREALRGGPLPDGAVVVVADHLNGGWLPAAAAVFTEAPGLQTPMGSGLMAHASAADRDRDPAARGGHPVAAAQFAPGGPR